MIRVKLFGKRACFTRPELKTDRYSYDVITPSAARNILQSIYWKPEFQYEILSIHVLNDIKFDSIYQNELKNIKINPKSPIPKNIEDNNRMRRNTVFLKDVCYVISANITETDDVGKHYNILKERLLKGKSYYSPYFGLREFQVNFKYLSNDEDISPIDVSNDFGLCFYDNIYQNNKIVGRIFYRCVMENGIIEVKSTEKVYSYDN